jgi:hypothetical protein
MKTKDLIAALQKEDPSGEIEVVANGSPIYFAERLPAYYDGPLHMLVQDYSIKTYNITGYKITTHGDKVNIHTYGLRDFVLDKDFHKERIIDLSELSDYHKQRYELIIKEIETDGI